MSPRWKISDPARSGKERPLLDESAIQDFEAKHGIRLPEDYRTFLKHFTCRLVLFGYRDLTKDPTKGTRECLCEMTPSITTLSGHGRMTVRSASRSMARWANSSVTQ